MQIFMRDISFAASEEDVKVALAQCLHRPPFPVDPLPIVNFHVDIFRDRSRKTKHRGIGILTLPSKEIGQQFLALYGERETPDLFGFRNRSRTSGGISIKNRNVQFKPSDRAVNVGLVERVRTTPWEDPKTLREEKERRAQLSGPISLSSFSFGRFCRDGVFSPEASYRGTVACSVENRRLEITHNGSVEPAPRKSPFDLDSLYRQLSVHFDDDNFPEGHLGADLLDDLLNISTTLSVNYSSNRIIALATPSNANSNDSEYQVFIQSDLPPLFERTVIDFEALLDQEPVSDRMSSFGDEDFRVTSRASQGLRLVFKSREDRETFLERCRALHTPKPVPRDIVVIERSIYAEHKLEALQDSLQSLDFELAFEVEKAVWGGILEPEEAVAMQDSLIELQNQTHNSEHAAIFRYFLTALSVPGLGSMAAPRRRRRRNQKERAIESPLVDLRAKLAEAIQAYIADLQRRSNMRYIPPAGICQSYHVILTPSTQILEGPLPDQSNSVLRRFQNNACFLRVSFQDENRSPPRRDARLSIDLLLERRYKKPLNAGLQIAGRPYEFLGYSMSGLKLYSFIFVTPFWFEGVMLDAGLIRDRLGDFSKIMYRPALLGARWSQAFSSSDPSVTLEENQIRYVEDKRSATGSVFTDGCSPISVDLTKDVWKSLRASQRGHRAPSALQFRCGGAKGVLVQDPRLPVETLCFRPSQTKFEVDVRTLDIAATSSRPILAYLNRPLIALLEYHGTPHSAFMALQNSAIEEGQSIRNSLLQASKIFSQHGFGASFRLPSLFNNLYYQLKFEIGDWSNPEVFRHELIKTVLAYATTQILREIKHRAHIIIPGSYTLIGVADEWDCLEDGEVYATVMDDRTGVYMDITGRILITRSPQIHPGDVQFVTAVRRPELAHLVNVVVFSCRGPRSLPSKLGGGDLDGDIYNLILDEDLFPPKEFTALPGEYEAIPPKETPWPCTVSDVVDFVIDFIKSDLLGYISILHLRIADFDQTDGPGCEACMELTSHASHAVDFSKRGVPVDMKNLPRAPTQLRPDFLSGEGVNPDGDAYYYPSLKILGQLYRNVPIEEYYPELDKQRTDGRKTRDALASIGLRRLGLPSVASDPSEDLLEEMRDILDEYSDQLMIIAKTHTISKRANAYLSEAELVSGTIQERYSDHRKRREAVSAMNLQTGELVKAIRHEFKSPDYREMQDTGIDEEEYDDEFEDEDDMAEDEERRRDKFERAWAAWIVAEEALDEDPSAYGPSSFGLLALGTMLEVIKEAKHLL
ncbi:RdRP-domain-containing protein [Mycena vitilis]|nr:RdRP-domain-containing protein [Mycena vitilis]